jgi:type VI secretion system protein ImpA
MSSQPVPSHRLDQLLQPIPGPQPCGESLRYEGAYDQIGAARRQDDAYLSQGVWKSPVKKADWEAVENLCVDLLRTRTKDLQIAAWLVEAWLHLDRFAGIREGLDLIHELVVRFWDGLHPQIVDGDLDFRTAPITWMNEKVSIQVKLLSITAPDSDDAPAYCWSDWENACRTEVPDPSLRSAASAANHPPKLTLAEFQRSQTFTPTGYFVELAADVESALESCAHLEAELDRRCGDQAPSLRQFFGVLEAIHAFVSSILHQRQPEAQPGLLPGEPRAPEEEPLADGMPAASGVISSRDEAYRRLAEAADYLCRTEPHSPAPYLVKRAIQWGSLSLPELLPELVRNQSELAELFRLLQLGDTTKPGK